MEPKMTAADRICRAIQQRPLTVVEIKDETGVDDVGVRRILGVAKAFGAVIQLRDPRSGLFRYGLSGNPKKGVGKPVRAKRG